MRRAALVAGDRASVGGREKGEEASLRHVRTRSSQLAEAGAQVAEKDRSLTDRMNAGAREMRMTNHRRAVADREDIFRSDAPEHLVHAEKPALVHG